MARFLLALLSGATVALWASVAQAGLCNGAPDEYVIEPIHGKVVDATRGEPIEGAVVIAHWEVTGPKTIKIMEALSDADGEFKFPGWGPIPRPHGACFLEYDPWIRAFKPGYFSFQGSNSFLFEPREPTNAMNPVSARVRQSRYHERDLVKLRTFRLGDKIEVRSPHTGQLETRPLTESDWCQQMLFTLSGFPSEHEKFVPKLMASLREQKKLYPRCLSGFVPSEEK